MMHSVDTSKYEWAHGKKPRGNGFWWFGNYEETWTFQFYGSYTDAKKAALNAAKEHDEFMTIYPLP